MRCVGLAAHVRRALDVVLAAQRIHAAAGLADVAGEQRQVDQRLDALGALHVLGHAEAVEDEGGARLAVETRGLADVVGVDAADLGGALRRPVEQERSQLGPALDALGEERLVDERPRR